MEGIYSKCMCIYIITYLHVSVYTRPLKNPYTFICMAFAGYIYHKDNE